MFQCEAAAGVYQISRIFTNLSRATFSSDHCLPNSKQLQSDFPFSPLRSAMQQGREIRKVFGRVEICLELTELHSIQDVSTAWIRSGGLPYLGRATISLFRVPETK